MYGTRSLSHFSFQTLPRDEGNHYVHCFYLGYYFNATLSQNMISWQLVWRIASDWGRWTLDTMTRTSYGEADSDGCTIIVPGGSRPDKPVRLHIKSFKLSHIPDVMVWIHNLQLWLQRVLSSLIQPLVKCGSTCGSYLVVLLDASYLGLHAGRISRRQLRHAIKRIISEMAGEGGDL